MPAISQAIAEGTDRLCESGVEHGRRTAGILLCHLLEIDRTHLLIRSEEQIEAAQYDSYLALVDRRAAGEPLQYITGHQEFYGLDFCVTPDVLIPRPETEFLVEHVIELAGKTGNETPLIVDIGTGSGCIAVTLAAHLPHANVIATDISHSALDVARANSERHGVRDRIEFVEGDLLAPLLERHLEHSIDILASNPPYVSEESAELIQREVREWEPHPSLFGGVDGLDFYRRLLVDAGLYLKPGGCLVFEIGFGQMVPLREMIETSGWEFVDMTNDLQGLPRIVTLRAPM